MKVAIMQPYVFPYIGYFQLINAVDTFVFYDDVNFIKKGFINRNSILVQGKANQFTIPCKAISQNKLINEVELNIDTKWTLKFLKTIEQAYNQAKYFNDVYPLITSFFSNHTHLTISEFAIASVLLITDYLGIDKNWVTSSKTHKASQQLRKENRILNIAKKELAIIYINPIGGKVLYNKEHFKTEGIHLNFIKSNPISYMQFTSEFVPSLSILDVIMFNSIETTNRFLQQYQLE